MAPRRGGGGSSGGSIDNQCDDYDAFESDYAKGQIAILGVLTFLFIVLAYLNTRTSAKRKKNYQPKRVLRWYQFGIALFLDLALFVIMTVRYVLVQCGVIYTRTDDTAIGVTIAVVQVIADQFLLGLILFPIVGGLFQLAGSTALRRTFKIIYIIAFVVVSIIAAVYVIIGILITYDVINYYNSSGSGWYVSYLRLWQAYVVLYLVLAIMGVAGLVIAWIRLIRKPEAKEGIVRWIPVLTASILGYSLYNCIYAFLTLYAPTQSLVAEIVGFAIAYLFFWFAYFSLFMMSRGKGWDWLDGNAPVNAPYHSQPIGSTGYTGPYDSHDPNKPATRPMSYQQPPTPAPPYGVPYSGGGNYEHTGQTYTVGGWGSSGYAPVHQVPTAYNPPAGAASRDIEQTELMGRR
ncbi:hypothetical protein ABW19_dt0202944 [Dactylella cylindrospora]|nr:hypothetical protein ABW19_dt0202944 [Dactylella cylindrospora]